MIVLLLFSKDFELKVESLKVFSHATGVDCFEVITFSPGLGNIHPNMNICVLLVTTYKTTTISIPVFLILFIFLLLYSYLFCLTYEAFTGSIALNILFVV